jgi:hypothetical protein
MCAKQRCSPDVGFRIVIGKGAIRCESVVCGQIARPRQDTVNHVGRTGVRYGPLTSEIKPIPMPPWHGARNVRTEKNESGRERFVRRQTELGSAGSGRPARLDPLALPVRFTASDAVADEAVRHVELHRERVILRRAVQGMRIALNVPVQAFLGVAIRLTPEQNGAPAGIGVFLEHRDPALSIELYSAQNSDDVVAEWQLWSRVLGVPCLVAGSDGVLASPFPMLGAVRFKAPAQRRRRRSAVSKRRPRFLARRRQGVTRNSPLIHQNEREIIARN